MSNVKKKGEPVTSEPVTIKFEDRHSEWTPHAGLAYACTNEEPELYEKLLEPHYGEIKKVGAICSGGEVVLQVFLSRGIETYAVDHGYDGLLACWTKIALLKQLGVQKTKALFTKHLTTAAIKEAILKASKECPVDLPSVLKNKSWLETSSHVSTILTDLRKSWHFLDEAHLEDALKHLDKLTLVHGDFTDLASDAPFDCIYISNILTHSSRFGTPLLSKLLTLLKPGGILLDSSSISYDNKTTSRCGSVELVDRECINGFRTSWSHHFSRVKGA